MNDFILSNLTITCELISQPETFGALYVDLVGCTKRNIAACDKPLDQHSSSLCSDLLVYEWHVLQATGAPIQIFEQTMMMMMTKQ